jgi:peroxiredoxin
LKKEPKEVSGSNAMEATDLNDAEVSLTPRVSVKTILALSTLAVFTIFITWRARLLEVALEQPMNVHVPAPDFRATRADGTTVSLADFRGKRVVLSFWASWCGPCQEEMGLLKEFYEAHHTASSDFEILAISIDEDTAQATHFAAKNKLSFPVLLDPHERIAKAYEEKGIPTLFIIDKDGSISYAHAGYETTDPLRKVLAHELGIDLDQPTKGGSGGGASD